MIDDRPGVDGSEKLLAGTKGRPFQLISQVDSESYDAGVQAISDYKLLIAGDAVTLVHGGVSSDGKGYRVLVNSFNTHRRISYTLGVPHEAPLAEMQEAWRKKRREMHHIEQ